MDGAFVTVTVRQKGPVTEPCIGSPFVAPRTFRTQCSIDLTGYVERMFGLTDDSRPSRHAEREAVIGPLTRALPGLRLFRKADVVEEVIVDVIAQQISLPFAYQCKARFVAAYGPRLTVRGITQYAMPRRTSSRH